VNAPNVMNQNCRMGRSWEERHAVSEHEGGSNRKAAPETRAVRVSCHARDLWWEYPVSSNRQPADMKNAG